MPLFGDKGEPAFVRAGLSADVPDRVARAGYAGDDRVWIRLPAERLRVEVLLGEVAVDGGLEVDDAVEDAASEPALGQGSKEAFDGVEPGRAGRREVEGYAG